MTRGPLPTDVAGPARLGRGKAIALLLVSVGLIMGCGSCAMYVRYESGDFLLRRGEGEFLRAVVALFKGEAILTQRDAERFLRTELVRSDSRVEYGVAVTRYVVADSSLEGLPGDLSLRVTDPRSLASLGSYPKATLMLRSLPRYFCLRWGAVKAIADAERLSLDTDLPIGPGVFMRKPGNTTVRVYFGPQASEEGCTDGVTVDQY